MWIRVHGPAKPDYMSNLNRLRYASRRRGGSKAEHTHKYVSILCRIATPPWALRRVFKMGFVIILKYRTI
jgi:hypothetical protein